MATLFSAIACLQTPAQQPTSAVRPDGLETPWDARKIVDDVQKQADEMEPLLAKIDPQGWVNSKGAPSTYIVQWLNAQSQVKNVDIVAERFERKTGSLVAGLDVYFRLEALEVTERSLEEGARRYDSRAVADKLAAMIARNFDGRQRMREYLQNLAASTEQDFKIADEEAQRCRSSLIKQTPAAGNRSKRK